VIVGGTVSEPAYGLRTVDDVEVEGKRVLLRADLNVRLAPGPEGSPPHVADDGPIRAALETIEELRRRGARLVLMSSLDGLSAPGRWPSMRPVAERLQTLTGVPVPLAPGVVGPAVLELTRRLVPGGMLMLENLRSQMGESRNDSGLASALAELGDVYVDDAFGGVHLAHASTEGVAHRLPCAAGRLMEREVLAMRAILERPARPLVVVLGGVNLNEKIGLVRRFLELADAVCIGGKISVPFLAALGRDIGQSPCHPEDVDSARSALAAPGADRLELPGDVILADGVALDIGRETAARYAARITAAATAFWSGPMGRFELPRFAAGTRVVADTLAWSSATTVVGGGATVEALRSFGLHGRVSHVSTDAAAMREFIQGRRLPSLRVLELPPRAPVALAAD
jgi:phosphoglycerate kinase